MIPLSIHVETKTLIFGQSRFLTHTGVYHLSNWTDSVDCLTFTAVGSSGQTWLKLGALKKIALCLGKLLSRLLLFCILLPCRVECYIYFYGQCVLQLLLHNTNRCTQYASIQHTHFVITLSLTYHFITNCISGSINVLLIYTNCTHTHHLLRRKYHLCSALKPQT